MRTLAAILTLTTLTLTSTPTAHAQTPSPATKMTAVLDFAAHNGFQGQVLAISNGKTVFEQARGAGIDSTTVFSIGSITKMFTAALILQLVEDGKLKLTDTLDKFYPQVPNAKKITIEQVLAHRSGIHDAIIDPKLRLAPKTESDHHTANNRGCKSKRKLTSGC